MRVASAVCALALAGRMAAAQGFPPSGPELQVNVTTAGDQTAPDVATEADGGTVVVWLSGGDAIYGRRYDASGAPRGTEFRIDVTPGAKGQPGVAAHANGGFFVVWHAPDADLYGVYARAYDAAGQPLGGEIAVNVTTASYQWYPRVDAGSYGYVVAWIGSSARIFSPSGAPLTGEIPIAYGDVAALPNGFVLANAQVGNPLGVVVTGYDTSGNRTFGPTLVQGPTPPPPMAPWPTQWVYSNGRVASDASGRSLVTWGLFGRVVTGGFAPMGIYSFDFGTFGRRLDASGNPLGPEFRVNVTDPGSQSQGAPASTRQGSTFVAWTSDPYCCSNCSPCAPPQDGSSSGIYARQFDAAGNDVSGEFRVNSTTQDAQVSPAVAAVGENGAFVAWMSQGQDGSGYGIFAQRYAALVTPGPLAVDITPSPSANGNGVFEPNESVVVAPSWRNLSGGPLALTSTASGYSGPAGPSYGLVDGTASFGTIAAGATASCQATGDCFGINVFGARPVAHWDATLTEQVNPATLFGPRTRSIHIGDSFLDVPRSSPFYRFIETVFHNDVIGSCTTGYFCPTFPVTREHMAPFVLAAFQPTLLPPACVAGAEMFLDVPASSPYCRWIEELARRGVVTGCGGGYYCPGLVVSRESMAVYLLATREGPSYAPPACAAPVFTDVPASSPFCRWIEELYRRGIVGGCGASTYCPTLRVARDQMSVFLTGTFGLLLYAP